MESKKTSNKRTAKTSAANKNVTNKSTASKKANENNNDNTAKINKGAVSSAGINLVPMDNVNGFDIRPGLYDINGATLIPCGVNFTVYSHHASKIELALFNREENTPFAVIPFPKHYKIGNVYSMIVFGLNIEEFEYAYKIDGPYDEKKGLIFNKDKYLLDPYARAVTGQSVWGAPNDKDNFYKGRVVCNNFDWKNTKQPLLPMEDLIIYEMHVRGFTKHSSSKTNKPGTFAAIVEKIPYLLELGVNVVELMPIFEFDEMLDHREFDGKDLVNYWGYSTVNFFAPNTSYTAGVEYNKEGTELKEAIKALNDAGIEVYLDVVFNHTAEGNEHGPFFSFKGFDNNIYYLLTPDGYYYNFSGCGNTLNCNHPIVQQLIINCLRYWVTTYHVDGFRFDLASILGRNEDGSPMDKPPLLQALAFDPILGDVKLIAEAWDAGGLYQVGNFPSWSRWAEWNGKYRDDMRQFLKGDDGYAEAAKYRIAGSQDLYDKFLRQNASVNFITCHDGFTLHDMYAYNEKHNYANGWDGTDGANDNHSWNCGHEGETDSPEINALRKRMVRNACAVLMCSRGNPMFLAGDEFENSQSGNNNAYCQDNEISWLDWRDLEKNKDTFEFFKFMIKFRKEHKCLRTNVSGGALGFDDVSFYSTYEPCHSFDSNDHYVGALFTAQEENKRPDAVFVAINTYWEQLHCCLPQLHGGFEWKVAVNTNVSELKEYNESVYDFVIPPRTVMVFVLK